MDNALELIKKMNEEEKELFKESLNALFTGTFVQRSVEKEKKLYRFIISNFNLFEDYLACAGWALRKDETMGIVSWTGPASSRFSLNLEETLGLLILRILYEEKQTDVSLNNEKTIQQIDFRERFKVLTNRVLNKTRLLSIIRRFQSFKLIRIIGDDANPESLIILYPSIAFAVDGETIDDIYDRINTICTKEEEE